MKAPVGLSRRKDQLKTLRDRLDLVSKTQPEILDLREKLLEIGGEELVALPLEIGLDPLVFLLAKGGEVMPHPIRLRKMESSRCHANVEQVMYEKKIAAMATGYALSEDGLWRNHSWGLKQTRNGFVIIETTLYRESYFGLTFLAGEVLGRVCDPKTYLIFKSYAECRN